MVDTAVLVEAKDSPALSLPLSSLASWSLDSSSELDSVTRLFLGTITTFPPPPAIRRAQTRHGYRSDQHDSADESLTWKHHPDLERVGGHSSGILVVAPFEPFPCLKPVAAPCLKLALRDLLPNVQHAHWWRWRTMPTGGCHWDGR